MQLGVASFVETVHDNLAKKIMHNLAQPGTGLTRLKCASQHMTEFH